MIKEYLYSKTSLFATVNVSGAIVAMFLANPLSVIAGSLAIIAGIFHVSITYQKWKESKMGWGYKLLARVLKWK